MPGKGVNVSDKKTKKMRVVMPETAKSVVARRNYPGLEKYLCGWCEGDSPCPTEEMFTMHGQPWMRTTRSVCTQCRDTGFQLSVLQGLRISYGAIAARYACPKCGPVVDQFHICPKCAGTGIAVEHFPDFIIDVVKWVLRKPQVSEGTAGI